MAKNLLKAIHVLEDFQQAKHLRILNEYGKSVYKIKQLAVNNLEDDLGFQKQC